MSSDIAIRVADLGKCYQIYNRPRDRLMQSLWRGRRQFYREFWALQNVSFEVGRGEAFAIIGRNGSGKSTLLQILAGTLAATSGEVEVNGRTAALLELGSGFSPEFTGRENVYMNAAILGLERAEIDRKFPEIEAFAGIDEFIDQPVKTYSSGMIMRLAFAVTVHVEPEVLIVDEALSVGDMAFQFKCLDRLNRLIASGTTLLFVSHDLGLVKAICQRAIYLSNGQLRAFGTADEVAEAYLQDVRDEQKSALVARKAATPQSAEKPADDISEPDRGRIAHACFVDSGSAISTYAYGDAIEIRVRVEYDSEIEHPALSVLVQDRRLIPVTGKICMISPGEGAQPKTRATIQFSLRAVFEAGAYFVTLRLEDRLSLTSFLPLDKQVGMLSFEVARNADQDFLGIVDTAMQSCELPDAAVDSDGQCK